MSESNLSNEAWIGPTTPSTRKCTRPAAFLIVLLDALGCVKKPFYEGSYWIGKPIEIRTCLGEYDKVLVLHSDFYPSRSPELVPAADSIGPSSETPEFGVSEEFLLDVQEGRYGGEWYSAFVAADSEGSPLGWATVY